MTDHTDLRGWYPVAPKQDCAPCLDEASPAAHSCPPHLARPMLALPPGAEYRSPHQGKQLHQSFAELVTYAERPLVAIDKGAHGGIVLGRFRDGVRRLTHFEGTSMIGLDYDDGKMTALELHNKLGARLHLTYTTFSSTSAKPKSRAIFFLDREIDGPTHKRVMRAVFAKLRVIGIELDAAAKDATRWWFVPMVHPDRTGHHEVHATPYTAAPSSVDTWLRHADELDAAYETELAEKRRQHPRDIPASPERVHALARGALASARERVLGASTGARHDVLNREAHSIARDELGLYEDDVVNVLVPAFVSVAGPEREREAIRTVRDAFSARRRGG